MDPIDLVRKLTGLRMQDLYNLMLKKGWTLGTPQTVRVLQFLIRLLHPQAVRLLEEFWRSSRADLVVSVVPHFNRALAESLRQVRPAMSLCHHPDRHRGLSAAFLDRAPGAVHHLRFGPRRGAGARPGHRRQPGFSSLGHDPAPALLSARPVRPARGAETARA